MCNLNSISSSNYLSLWNRYQNIFKKTDHLATAIKDLASDHHFVWNQERQQLILQALNQRQYSSYSFHLKKICSNIKSSELHQLLKASALIHPSIKPPSKEGTLAFQRLTHLLTVEQIQAAIHTEFPSFETALEKAREIRESAKYYLDLAHPPAAKSPLRNILTHVIWAIDHTIDTLLYSFGANHLKELRKDDISGTSAQQRLQLFISSFSKLSACVTLAVAVSGSIYLGLAITGAALLIGSALIMLYFKFFKPIPRIIHGWRNLTTEAISGNLTGAKERQKYIDEIANTLITGHQKPKIHPMLVGPSGAGKTEILYGFALAVAEGRYPALKGKQVFYINTAELTKEGNKYFEPTSLQRVQERIRGRNNDVILIFDETHIACKERKENEFLSERLQKLLDVGKDNFTHVIGCTTDEEYSTYIQPNKTFARRFKQIPVKETSKIQTLAILKKNILSHRGLYVTEEAIEAIYDLSKKHFPDSPQPYGACRLLTQAIYKSKESTVSQLQSQIEEKQAALEMHLSSQLLGIGMDFFQTSPHKEFEAKKQELHQHIDLLTKQMNEEKENVRILQYLIDQLEQVKEKILRLSMTLETSKQVNALSKEFALSSYLIQAWTHALQEFMLAKGKGIARIDLSVVSELIRQQ